ncbi:MAG TPA: DUF4157 domain-containing protein [Pyrinomonadaceae bacterium]|nr:DUF4157 domain-containing protein [Pyrinomonadaceae bacterium]
MKLSRETHFQLQVFFRKYFDDNNLQLPAVEIYVNRGAGFITKILSVHGITIGRHIFIKPQIAKYDERKLLTISKNLLAHEVTHVVQYQQLGFFGFLFKYTKDYLLILRGKKKWDALSRNQAYWEIPHEIEARDAAQEFEKWVRQEKELI